MSDRAYRRVVRHAFARVPFYRDQWVAAGRALDEPAPVPSAALAGQEHRLCPFARPFDPSREPSLWIEGSLREALSVVGAPRRVPVLEVRQAVLDRRRYGVLLSEDALVVDETRRRELNAEALGRASRVVVVGESAPPLPGVEVTLLRRVTLGHAEDGDLVHDPHLGYFAARASCGRIHLLGRRFHAQGHPPALTALRSRRPTLVAVIPDDPGQTRLASCAEHGTPIFEQGADR